MAKPECPRCAEPATTAEERRYRGRPDKREVAVIGPRTLGGDDEGQSLKGAHPGWTDLDGVLWWMCVECGCVFEPKSGRRVRNVSVYDEDVRVGWCS